jgi:hypothetical protein
LQKLTIFRVFFYALIINWRFVKIKTVRADRIPFLYNFAVMQFNFICPVAHCRLISVVSLIVFDPVLKFV